MTDAQLDVARRHEAAWARELGYPAPNTRFVKGRIEYLDEAGIPDASVDVVISNCVLNLSAEKPRCLRQVHRALADGGEFLFSGACSLVCLFVVVLFVFAGRASVLSSSGGVRAGPTAGREARASPHSPSNQPQPPTKTTDVYSDRRLPAAARTHEVALGECLGGALYVNDFLELARAAGFSDGARALAAESIEVHDAELNAVLGGAKFYSVTFRCAVLPAKNNQCAGLGVVDVLGMCLFFCSGYFFVLVVALFFQHLPAPPSHTKTKKAVQAAARARRATARGLWPDGHVPRHRPRRGARMCVFCLVGCARLCVFPVACTV
jgi:SAM-dependent methyltransferase